MNSVNMIGNLTRDPEVRYTSAGNPITTFGIAWNGREKQNGEWVDKPHYFNVTAFGETWEKRAAMLAKGMKIGLSGRLDFSSWVTQEGAKRTAVGIVAFDMTFCQPKGSNGGGGGTPTPADGDIPVAAFTSNDFVPVGAATAEDDDIPF